MVLSLPRVTARRNGKHRRRYTSTPGCSRLLTGARAAAWAGAGPSQHRSKPALPLPCRCGRVELPRHCQSCPLQWTSARPSAFPYARGESQAGIWEPFMGTQCSVCTPDSPPDSPALGWMGSGGEETFCNKKDKALCCGHLPRGTWGTVTFFPGIWPWAN